MQNISTLKFYLYKGRYITNFFSKISRPLLKTYIDIFMMFIKIELINAFNLILVKINPVKAELIGTSI